jgi:hypothetical protein
MINLNKYDNKAFNHVILFCNNKEKSLSLIYEDNNNRFEKDEEAHYKEITREVEEELNDKAKQQN